MLPSNRQRWFFWCFVFLWQAHLQWQSTISSEKPMPCYKATISPLEQHSQESNWQRVIGIISFCPTAIPVPEQNSIQMLMTNSVIGSIWTPKKMTSSTNASNKSEMRRNVLNYYLVSKPDLVIGDRWLSQQVTKHRNEQQIRVGRGVSKDVLMLRVTIYWSDVVTKNRMEYGLISSMVVEWVKRNKKD